MKFIMLIATVTTMSALVGADETNFSHKDIIQSILVESNVD